MTQNMLATMSMLGPGPLSLQEPNKIPSLVLRRGQLSSWTRNTWCSAGHTLTLSHSHPSKDCFGVFLCLLRNLWQPFKPRQVCTGQRSWANDLQAAQELAGSRGLMVISTQITPDHGAKWKWSLLCYQPRDANWEIHPCTPAGFLTTQHHNTKHNSPPVTVMGR